MKSKILYIILFAAVMLLGTYMVCAAQLTAQVLVNGTVWNCDTYINTCTDFGGVDFMEKLGEICTVENYNHCLSQSCDAAGAHPTQCNHYMTGDEIRDKLADFSKPKPKEQEFKLSGPIQEKRKIDDKIMVIKVPNLCDAAEGTVCDPYRTYILTTDPKAFNLDEPLQYVMIDGVKWYMIPTDKLEPGDICAFAGICMGGIDDPIIVPRIGGLPHTYDDPYYIYRKDGSRVMYWEEAGGEVYPELTFDEDENGDIFINVYNGRWKVTTDPSQAYNGQYIQIGHWKYYLAEADPFEGWMSWDHITTFKELTEYVFTDHIRDIPYFPVTYNPSIPADSDYIAKNSYASDAFNEIGEMARNSNGIIQPNGYKIGRVLDAKGNPMKDSSGNDLYATVFAADKIYNPPNDGMAHIDLYSTSVFYIALSDGSTSDGMLSTSTFDSDHNFMVPELGAIQIEGLDWSGSMSEAFTQFTIEPINQIKIGDCSSETGC